jgi:hypothetical protein
VQLGQGMLQALDAAEMNPAAPHGLPRFREQLREAGVLTDELEATIAAEVKKDIDEATDYAENAPEQDPRTAMQWVFAEDWPGETPPSWGFGASHGLEGHEGDTSAAEDAVD